MTELRDVAVVICTRNREHFLEKALTAVRARTDDAVELLVVDSASDTWATRTVVSAVDGVHYVRADVKGVSIARNVGWRATKRPVVVYTDDDCEAADDWLDRLLPHFDDPSVGAVTGRLLDHTLIGSAGEAGPSVRRSRVIEGIDAGHGALMAFRRDVLERLGGFDDVLGTGRVLAGAEDLDMFCRVIHAGGSVVHEPASVMHHMFTREDDAYAALHHGYGLGLGALANKWVRLRPAIGFRLLAVVTARTLGRLVRSIRTPRRSKAAARMLTGIARGFAIGMRHRLEREVFVDRDRPPVVVPAESAR